MIEEQDFRSVHGEMVQVWDAKIFIREIVEEEQYGTTMAKIFP
jgi:hypothetical protein